MPRILKACKSKYAKIVFAGIVIALTIVIQQYWIIAVFILFLLTYIFNKKIIRKINMQRKKLSSDRPVAEVNTLIIGDMYSPKMLSKYCRLDHSLSIVAPYRSLASSALILNHVESILSPSGTVIIVESRGGNCEPVSVFDFPYINMITEREMGVDRKAWINSIPVLRYPVRSFLFLTKIGERKKICLQECPNKDLVELCKRKGFKLLYLR